MKANKKLLCVLVFSPSALPFTFISRSPISIQFQRKFMTASAAIQDEEDYSLSNMNAIAAKYGKFHK